MTGKNEASWIYNPAAGSTAESQMTGGAGTAAYLATGAGLSNTTGLLQINDGVRGVDRRLAVTTSLGVCAAAASGAALFSQVAGPGGAIAAAGLGILGNSINGGLMSYDAQRSMAALKQIDKELEGIPKSPGELTDLETVREVVHYCIGKQSGKRIKGAANMLMVGQPLVPVYKTGKAMLKFYQGTKGVNRTEHSRKLVEIARKDVGKASEYARRVVEVLVAKNFDDVLTDAVANAMKSG
jgi:hypothetical protein